MGYLQVEGMNTMHGIRKHERLQVFAVVNWVRSAPFPHGIQHGLPSYRDVAHRLYEYSHSRQVAQLRKVKGGPKGRGPCNPKSATAASPRM